jgi:3-oxoacyl-[acyl-carrier-protein] synthase-3
MTAKTIESHTTAKAPRAVITGAGHWIPENVLNNQFFNDLDIGSEASWIEERTGIVERRSILNTTELAALRHGKITRDELLKNGRIMDYPAMTTACWQMASSRAGGAKPVQTVIAGTSVPDDDIPAHACSIAARNQIECQHAFDVNSACSTFVVHLHMARSLVASGHSTSLALFTGERYTTRVDYSDRKTCILFGDSAAGVTVEAEAPRGLEIVDSLLHSQPSGAKLIRLPDGGIFDQDGQAVQKFAVQKTISAAEEILARNHLTTRDLTWFIGHQANLRMLTWVADKLHLTPQQHLYNVDRNGNQGGAGAPTVLSMNWDKFKSGDLIVVSVVGSGLTWGSALLRCI